MDSPQSQVELVAALRDAGLPMRGRQAGSQIGYTTRPELAERARELGARVHPDRAPTPRGWEVVAPPDAPASDSRV